jgi:hypothetical protein
MGDRHAHPSYYFSMTMFSRLIPKSFVIVFAALLLNFGAANAFGADLHVSAVAGKQGTVVKLAVSVDKVDNLAGIKLSLAYNKDVLKFVKAEKTSYTANMLHVVNDKVPGRLIIVMAAARGFAGEKAPLVEMSFELLQDVKEEDKVRVQITEAELMSDKLQKIDIKSP